MRPIVHNTVSYGVALVVFVLAYALKHGSSLTQPTRVVEVQLFLWSLHFGRRTLESLFMHIYTAPNISTDDSVTEFVYYWGFATWICCTGDVATFDASSLRSVLGLMCWVICETCNSLCHLTLRKLRQQSITQRQIPRGAVWFDRVSCPHYFL
jgi:hypothetical protein